MLTDAALKALCDRHHVTAKGYAWLKAVRSNPPNRRVRSGITSIPCRFPSIKMGQTIQAESHTIELSAIYLMEYDAAVLEYWDQPNPPIDLHYKTPSGKGIRTQYTPDFLIISEAFIGFEEWKPLRRLQELIERQPARYCFENGGYQSPPVTQALAPTGLGFRIRSDAELNPTLVNNLKFLAYYLSLPEDKRGVIDLRQPVERVFLGRDWISLSELIEACSTTPVDALYEALAAQHVFVDLAHDDLSDPLHCRVFKDKATCELVQSTQHAGSPAHTIEALPDCVIAASPKSIELATKRARWVRRVQQGEPMEAVAAAAGVSSRTLRRWLRAFEKAEQTLGSGYFGLLPKQYQRGNRTPRLPTSVVELVHEVIRAHYVNQKQKNAYQVYGQVLLACEAHQVKPPSMRFFYNLLTQYGQQEITAARAGKRAAYQMGGYESLDAEEILPAYRAKRVFEQCEIDHTPLDIELISERSGVALGRPWLSVVFDDYCRRVMGFYLTFKTIRKVIEKTAHHKPEPQTFPISDHATEVLTIWHKQKGEPVSGYVFPSPVTGKRLDKGAMQKPWQKVREAGGLPDELQLYTLRHHFASTLVMDGVDLLTVSRLMAHSDINTTIEHYGHLQPNRAREVVNAFARQFDQQRLEALPVATKN